MTGEFHIISWIESSKPHYDKLLYISVHGNFLSDASRARVCMNLAVEVYHEMIKYGYVWASDHDASTIIGAALAIANWTIED